MWLILIGNLLSTQKQRDDIEWHWKIALSIIEMQYSIRHIFQLINISLKIQQHKNILKRKISVFLATPSFCFNKGFVNHNKESCKRKSFWSLFHPSNFCLIFSKRRKRRISITETYTNAIYICIKTGNWLIRSLFTSKIFNENFL